MWSSALEDTHFCRHSGGLSGPGNIAHMRESERRVPELGLKNNECSLQMVMTHCLIGLNDIVILLSDTNLGGVDKLVPSLSEPEPSRQTLSIQINS